MTRTVSLVAALMVMTLSTTTPARAGQPHESPQAMVVTKSSNRNEVHYAVSVDAACMPVANAPVYAYWQMLERGPHVTEALSMRERAVLGIATQEVSHDTVRFVLRGTPARVFVAHLEARPDGTCGAWIETTIAGERARVSRVYIKEKLFGIDYVLLSGRRPDGTAVDERLHP